MIDVQEKYCFCYKSIVIQFNSLKRCQEDIWKNSSDIISQTNVIIVFFWTKLYIIDALFVLCTKTSEFLHVM